jgi:hypothetical protein
MGIMRGNPLGNLEIVEAGSVVQSERKIHWKADYELSGRTGARITSPAPLSACIRWRRSICGNIYGRTASKNQEGEKCECDPEQAHAPWR